MGHSFIIPYGEDKEHAAALQRGLAVLGEEYAARLCFACSGRGQYNQTYTAGCGGGYFQSMGPCAYCGEIGLRYGDETYATAPASVIEQVLNAGAEHQ